MGSRLRSMSFGGQATPHLLSKAIIGSLRLNPPKFIHTLFRDPRLNIARKARRTPEESMNFRRIIAPARLNFRIGENLGGRKALRPW